MNKTDSDELSYEEKNRQKAREFAEKVRNGYIPIARLKDDIVMTLYGDFAGTDEKPSYDDLVEFRNFIVEKKDSTSNENENNDAQEDKTEVKSERIKVIPPNPPTNEPVVFDHEFNGIGKIDFDSDGVCRSEDGSIIGLWNLKGKVFDESGKQIAHLPESKMSDFDDFLYNIGKLRKRSMFDPTKIMYGRKYAIARKKVVKKNE